MFFFSFVLHGCAICTVNISEAAKKEYTADFHNAFIHQAEGMSTHATYYFEQGCMKAMKAGEISTKIEAIRKLFVWYRTYGFYLGLIKKDPEIFGQYIGGGQYSNTAKYPRSYKSRTFSSNAEKRAEYLFGTAEVLSGILCFAVGPPIPSKYVLGVSLVAKGVERIWDVVRPSLFQDIPAQEFTKVSESLKAAE